MDSRTNRFIGRIGSLCFAIAWLVGCNAQDRAPEEPALEMRNWGSSTGAWWVGSSGGVASGGLESGGLESGGVSVGSASTSTGAAGTDWGYESGDVGDGACCESNGTPGCDDETCEADVCAEDPYCCAQTWDGVCANEADFLCGPGYCPTPATGGASGDGSDSTTGTGGDAGDCCEWNGTPGCNDETCETAVCLDDPYCCDVLWDALCAEAAATECSLGCDSGTTTGTGGGDSTGTDTGYDTGYDDGGDGTTGGAATCPLTKDGKAAEFTITVGSTTRKYVVWTGTKATFPAPGVFAWHGWGAGPYDAGPRLKPGTHWDDALVIAPQGLKRTFEGLSGNLPGFQSKKGELGDRDLKMYDAIYKYLVDKKCLDPDKAYQTGFSNGGFMTHVVACHRGKQVAAASPGGAHGPFKTPCQDKVPILISHGRNDELVKLDGAKSSWRSWLKTNGCTAGQAIPADGCKTAAGCPAKEPVRFCNWNAGHTWYNGRAKRIADFMRAYKKSD